MDSTNDSAEYYYVSAGRFALFSILSFGLWDFYWFYKHWDYIRKKERTFISPMLRAIFSLFFAYSLFKRINASLKEKGISVPISALFLFLIYIFTYILGGVIEELFTPLIPSLSFLPLLFIQNQINLAYKENNQPNHQTITWPQIIIIATGIFLWILLILGQTGNLEL